MEGPLDEELEERDGRLLGEPIELSEEVRELGGVGDSVDVTGLPARCAKLVLFWRPLGETSYLPASWSVIWHRVHQRCGW